MWDPEKIHPKNIAFVSVVVLTFAAILLGSSSPPVSAAGAEMYYSMGQEYVEKDNFDMAVLAFERAVELSPEWPEAHNSLGEAYAKLLRFEDALGEFDRALELKQDYVQAEKNRRRAMTAIKQYTPMESSRVKSWHKVAILGGITAAIAIISALVVLSVG